MIFFGLESMLSNTAMIAVLLGVLAVVVWLTYYEKEGYEKRMSMFDVVEFDALDPELKKLLKESVGAFTKAGMGKLSAAWRMLSASDRGQLISVARLGMSMAVKSIQDVPTEQLAQALRLVAQKTSKALKIT